MCGNPLNNCGCNQPCNCSSGSCLQVKTFNAATGVNITTDVITITNHDFLTGQKVLYTAVGGAAPTGLVTNTEYFVIKVNNNTFKLATTLANSINGIAIDITAVGVGASHILTASNLTTPVPCLEGCLTDTRTDCTFLSEDLDICTNILPKGTTVTQALEDLAAAVCNGVVITTQDVKVKIDANDTTNGYLFDKITVCNNLTKTITNVNGNEKLELCAKLDTVSGAGNNLLTSGINGLYLSPQSISGYNLVAVNNNSSVLLSVNSILGGQTISAIVNKDTTTGGNNNILQVNPAGVYVPPNTPISVVLPASSGLNLTATGTNNHTLTASVKLDTISGAGNNILALGPNGLYVPPSSGSGSSITINSTNTILSQLSNSVYSLSVIRSTDPGQGLVLDSTGKLYVNDIEEPNSLGFVVNGYDIYFEFQGPSLLSTDYEVQIQGTTGNPSLWITASFDSLTGPVLRYDVATTINPATIRARVRTKVGTVPANTRYSNWVGKTYDPAFTLVSDYGTISVSAASSGINNQFSVDIANQTCNNNFSTVGVGRSIIKIGDSYFVKITRTAASLNSDVYTIQVVEGIAVVAGITISNEQVILIPLQTYIPGETYELGIYRHCTFGTTMSPGIVLSITTFPTPCTTDGYVDVPLLVNSIFSFPGFSVSGVGVNTARASNSNLQYIIYNDYTKNYLEFSGVLKLTSLASFPASVDTGWQTLINIAEFASCTTPTNNIYKIEGQNQGVTTNYNYETDTLTSYKTYQYYLRRSGNLIQIRIPFYDGGANPLNTFVNLSGLKF